VSQWLRQSTARTIQFGPFLDKTDGVSLEVGLVTALDNATTGIRISKNGATLIARAATVTTSVYDAMGLYKVVLSATDTDTLGALKIIFEESATCLPVWQDFMVLPANAYDALFAGTGVGLRANVQGWLGTAPTTPGTAGVPNVDVARAANTAWASGAITAASIASNAIAAAKIEASALNGKGDWNVGKTGYSLTATTGLGNQTANLTGNVTGSVGSVTGAVGSVTGAVGSVTGAVGSVTGSVGSVVGHTAQTGDNFAIVNGAAGLVAIDTVVDAIKVVTDQFVFTVANQVDANTLSISGDGPAADNAEAFFDGTGYAGTNNVIPSVTLVDTTTTNTDMVAAAPTAAAIADAVWDEPVAGHVAAGSFGKTDADILADTNELQADWADAGRLDTILDARMAEASIATTGGAVDNVTLVATTTTNTDMRGTDSAATAASLATAQLDLDTITGADGVNLLSATQASVDAIEAGVNVTQVAGNTAAATNLSAAARGMVVLTVNTGNVASSTTTCQCTGLTETTADHWIGQTVVFYDTGDTLYGQKTDITDSAWDAANSEIMLTFTALTSAPLDGDLVVLV